MADLTREQRERLFAGEFVRISGEAPCRFEKGQTVRLSSRVTLEVKGIRWKQGRWSLRYVVLDRRDPANLIKRTPSLQDEDFEAIRRGFDQYGYPQEPTPDVLRLAARGSAYTSMPSAAVSDAGEAIDEKTQARFTKEAQDADGLREARRRERWEAQTLAERVAALEGSDQADISRILASIERRVRAAESKLRRVA